MFPTFHNSDDLIGTYKILAPFRSGSTAVTFIGYDTQVIRKDAKLTELQVDPQQTPAVVLRLIKPDYTSPTTRVDEDFNAADIFSAEVARGRQLQKCPGIISFFDTIRGAKSDDGIFYYGAVSPCGGHRKIGDFVGNNPAAIVPLPLSQYVSARFGLVDTTEALAFTQQLFSIFSGLHKFNIPGQDGPTLHNDINNQNVIIERDFFQTHKGIEVLDAGPKLSYSAMHTRAGSFIPLGDSYQQELFGIVELAYELATGFELGADIVFGTRDPIEISRLKQEMYANGKRNEFKLERDRVICKEYTPAHVANPRIHRDFDEIVLRPGLTSDLAHRYSNLDQAVERVENFNQYVRPNILARAKSHDKKKPLEEVIGETYIELIRSFDGQSPYPSESFDTNNYPWALHEKSDTFMNCTVIDYTASWSLVWLDEMLQGTKDKKYEELLIRKADEIVSHFNLQEYNPTVLGINGAQTGAIAHKITNDKKYLEFMEKCAQTAVDRYGRWSTPTTFFFTQNVPVYPQYGGIISSLYKTGSVLLENFIHTGKFKKELIGLAQMCLPKLADITIGRDSEFFIPDDETWAGYKLLIKKAEEHGFGKSSIHFVNRFLVADLAKTAYAARRIARALPDIEIPYQVAYDKLIQLGNQYNWNLPFDANDEKFRFDLTKTGISQDMGAVVWSLRAFLELDELELIKTRNITETLFAKLLDPKVLSKKFGFINGVPQLSIGLRPVKTSIEIDAIALESIRKFSKK